MTVEEAIAYWEEFQREIDLLYPLCNERSKATLGEQREPVALALSALRAQQQTEANEPLTLDELRKMEGEPVWVVLGECGCLKIVDIIYMAGNKEIILFNDKSSYMLAYYGKTWLAYRHKPKEA